MKEDSAICGDNGTKSFIKVKRFFAVAFPILSVVLAAVVIWVAMDSDEVSLPDVVGVAVNWWWVLGAVGVAYFFVAMESLRTQIMMKVTTGRSNLGLAFRDHTLNQFYQMVTPMMSGGHPYSVFYLHKNGLPVHEATSVALARYITGRIGFQTSTGLLMLVLFPVAAAQLGGGAVVGTGIVLSIVFNVILSVIMIYIAFSPFAARKLSSVSIWILVKVRLVRDREKAKRRTEETLWKYRVAIRKLQRRPGLMAAAVLMYMVAYTARQCMIFFIYAALFGWSWEVLPALLLGIILTDYLASFVPIPGGTGAMELFFLAVFATVMGSPQILVAVVLWKGLSYLLPIFNGVLVIAFDSIKSPKKRHTSTCENHS